MRSKAIGKLRFGRLLGGCLLSALAIASPGAYSATAITLDIPVLDDGRVLHNYLGDHLYTSESAITMVRSGGNNVSRGLFEFDLSGIPAGGTITAATLLLTTSSLISNTSSPAPMYYYSYTGNGLVELADYSIAAIQVAAGSYATGSSGVPVNTQLQVVFASLAPLVTAQAQPSPYFGVRTEVPNFVTLGVHSEEAINSAYRPVLRLSVIPIPEPETWTLLSAGLGLLALRRAR